MLVDLSTRTLRIVVFRLSLCDLEVGAWDDDIARVCRSRPLLTVYTMAERSRGGLSCCNISPSPHSTQHLQSVAPTFIAELNLAAHTTASRHV